MPRGYPTVKKTSVHYEFIPVDFTCASCGGDRDKVNFSFTSPSRKYLRRVCNNCRRLIERGELIAPKKLKEKIPNLKKREIISYNIAEYFQQQKSSK